MSLFECEGNNARAFTLGEAVLSTCRIIVWTRSQSAASRITAATSDSPGPITPPGCVPPACRVCITNESSAVRVSRPQSLRKVGIDQGARYSSCTISRLLSFHSSSVATNVNCHACA